VKKALRLILTILVYRPLITILMGLFYVTAALIAATAINPPNLGEGLVALLIIPTAGLFALSAERLLALRGSSLALGLPGFTNAQRHAQWALVAGLIAVPITGMVAVGVSPLLAATIAAPAAIGILLVLRGPWVFFGVLALVLIGNTGRGLSDWVFGPWGQAVLVAFGATVLVLWLRNPEKPGRRTIIQTPRFADSRQEASTKSLAQAVGAPSAAVEAYLRVSDARLDSILNDLRAKRMSRRTLWYGIGLDTTFRSRPLLWQMALGTAALGIWHLEHGQQPDFMAYGLCCMFAGMRMLTGYQQISRTLQRTVTEQSLLVLTPTWPAPAQLTRHLMNLIAVQLGTTWLLWSVVTALGRIAGWIAPRWMLWAATGLFAVTVSIGTSYCVNLVRKSASGEQVQNAVILLLAVSGAGLWIFGMEQQSPLAWLGAALLLLPGALAAIALKLRPLRFPVNASTRER